MSGAVSASGRFVFQFICLPIHLSPRSCGRGCVRLRGIGFPIHLSPNSFVSQSCGLCPPPGDLSPNSFVRLVSGAVSASGRFVSQFICLPGPCLPIHLSPRSCVRGCVRLRGIGFPIHLSPNSFVSQVLCQGLCPPPGDLSPNSFVRLVSRAVSASGRFVSHSFVSQFICLPGPVSGAVSASGGLVSQFICLPIHLSPRSCVRGCVRLRGICLPIHLSALCQGLCPPPDDLSPNSFVSQFICLPGPCLPIHLSPRSCGRGCVRLRGIGFPIHLSPNSFVSQVLCQGLCPPPGDLSPNSFVRLVSGAVPASGRFVSQFICLPIHLSPRSLSPNSLSPRSCGRGCVRLWGIGFPIHLSPESCVRGCVLPGPVSGAVSASGRFVSQFICLPIHLSPRSLSPNSFVSQVLWQGLCPPPGDWFPNSFVSQFISLPGPVSGAVSASGGFVSQFICPPCVKGCVRLRTICLPSHLSPNSFVSQVLCQGLCPPPGDLSPNSFVSQFICLPGPVSGAVSASLGSVSPIICLPSFVSHVLCQGLCPPPWALCLPSVPKQFTVGVLNSLSSGVRLCSDGGVWLSGCLTYLFVVFCKDLLCISYTILAQGLSFVRSLFLFLSSQTTVCCGGCMAFTARYFAFLAVHDVLMSIHFFSLVLGIPGGPGRHGWSIDLGVFTVSLDFWNSFSAQFGFGTMDTSLDLWSLVEDLDTTPDTNVVRSLPLPSRPKSAPLQRDHQPPGPRLASPFQVSDLVSRPVSSMGSSGHSTAPRHSGIPRVSDLNQNFSFLPPQPNYRDSIRTSVGSNPLPIPPHKVPVSQSWTAVHRNHELPHPPDPGVHGDSGPQHERTNPPMHLALHPPKRQQGSMTRFRFSSASPLLGQMWFELLSMLGPLSRIWQETQISPHQRLHLNRLLDNIAPGTAMKYLSSCQSFFRTCKALQVNLGSLTEVQLADILITMSLSRSTSHSSSSCSSVIKALRWLVKAADVGCLQVIHSNIIGSFLNQKIPRDRKQAPPLPLWTLVQWERRILMAQCTVTETILLGTFLVMAWGSLRFSDAQRMDLQNIIYQDATMRGIIWRSKTAVSGMPLAIAAEGFLSKGSHNWVWKFLTVMDDILTQSGLREVDFLLPMVDDQGPIYPLVPMDYATALFYLSFILSSQIFGLSVETATRPITWPGAELHSTFSQGHLFVVGSTTTWESYTGTTVITGPSCRPQQQLGNIFTRCGLDIADIPAQDDLWSPSGMASSHCSTSG